MFVGNMTTQLKWYKTKQKPPEQGTKVLIGAYNRYERRINVVDICYFDKKKGVWWSLPNQTEWPIDYYNFWARI